MCLRVWKKKFTRKARWGEIRKICPQVRAQSQDCRSLLNRELLYALPRLLFRQPVGVQPFCYLNTMLKYCAELNPRSRATSVTAARGSLVNRSAAASIRMRVTSSSGVNPVSRLKATAK